MEEGHAEACESWWSAMLHPPSSVAPPIFFFIPDGTAAAVAAREAADSSIAPLPSMTDRRPAEIHTQTHRE